MLGNSEFCLLLVEGNSRFRHSLKDLLCERFPRIRIMEEGDGGEVLHTVERHVPNMIFMDLGLPHVNGLALTKRIRERHPLIVIAVLTNHDSPEYEAAAYESGADYFLSKQSTTPGKIQGLVASQLKGKGQTLRR